MKARKPFVKVDGHISYSLEEEYRSSEAWSNLTLASPIFPPWEDTPPFDLWSEFSPDLVLLEQLLPKLLQSKLSLELQDHLLELGMVISRMEIQ